MRSFIRRYPLGGISIVVITLLLCLTLLGNRAILTNSEQIHAYPHIVIDAGHGGEDGGAVSCTGIKESQLNLEIAMRLEDLLHLLGYKTIMIRNSDRSIYTSGETIAARKVSDIRQRVHIANSTPHAVVVSIHQNFYPIEKYNGAQVFYNSNPGSKELAEAVQAILKNALNPTNKRKIKRSTGIFLLEHINCTGILIECGFLSNPEDETNLKNTEYQKKMCCAVSSAISQFLNS